MDNAYSVLDKTDLVMIDPVGTGLSKAVGDAKDKDFWGADPDIESVSRFIRQYVSDNGRWNSPKYLLGESYGTTRAGGIVDWLQGRGMSFNGVVLVSVALDLSALFDYPGNDKPYPLILPGYAAVSAYHKLLPAAPKDLEAFLTEVRQYAAGEYASALMAGDSLSDARRAAVVKKLHEYTGLSEDYLDAKGAPIAVNNFVFLAQHHLYEGTWFHRILSTFVIQGGDPKGDGTGGPGYQFTTETNPTTKFADASGLLAYANSGPDTNGSQFFITLAKLPNLDPPNNGPYTIFGTVTQGFDVVKTIAKVPTTANPSGVSESSCTVN